MREILILFLLIVFISCSQARDLAVKQNNNCSKYYDKSLKIEVYTIADEPAEYPDGMNEVGLFLAKNTRYPDQDQLQVKATVSFIVDKLGKLKDIKIYRKEVRAYTKLDWEIIRVVNLMQKWKSAKCSGNKVASLVVIPLHIDVQGI